MTSGKAPAPTSRIALVTGASRGIGYFLARELAANGHHVIAVARDNRLANGQPLEIKLGGGQATLVPLDLKDMAGIDRLGGAINERFGKLDVLVANAGILGTISPIDHIEAKVFEQVMTINVTATWRLIRSVNPLLQRSDAGRAIVLSSAAAHKCRPFWGPYSASKAAVEALSRTWAGEAKNTSLRVNSVNPGPTRPAMRAQAMPGEDPETLPHPEDVAKAILPLAQPQLKENGLLFDVSSRRFQDYRLPE